MFYRYIICFYLPKEFHRDENKHRVEIQNRKCLHFFPFGRIWGKLHNVLRYHPGYFYAFCNPKFLRLYCFCRWYSVSIESVKSTYHEDVYTITIPQMSLDVLWILWFLLITCDFHHCRFSKSWWHDFVCSSCLCQRLFGNLIWL